MTATRAEHKVRVTFLLVVLAIIGCDDSFDLASYEGRYGGPATASAGPATETAPALYGQGVVRIAPIPGNGPKRASFDIRFDDRRLFLFEGPYDSGGWTLVGVGERDFEVSVTPDGLVTGAMDRPDLGIALDGRFLRDFLGLAIELTYRETAAGIPAGTRITVDFSVERGGS